MDRAQIVAAFALALVLPRPADAAPPAIDLTALAPSHRLPGSNCTVFSGKPSYANGAIVNAGTEPLSFECPLLAVWEPVGGGPVYDGLFVVSARVADNNPTQDITCTFFTGDLSTTTPNLFVTTSYETKTSSGATGLPQEMFFQDVAVLQKTIAIVRCTIPPKGTGAASALISYGGVPFDRP